MKRAEILGECPLPALRLLEVAAVEGDDLPGQVVVSGGNLHGKRCHFLRRAEAPAGISSASWARSSAEKQAFISVSITPQAIALTWMLLGASSLARARVKELMPPLQAEYATSQEAPTFPQIEEMFKIFPDFWWIMCGRASLLAEKTEVRLTPMMRFHSSMGHIFQQTDM